MNHTDGGVVDRTDNGYTGGKRSGFRDMESWTKALGLFI